MYFYCKDHGFTLFELIVTISIISILSLICIPYYHNLMQKQELNSIRPLTQQYLSFAKSQALLLHSPVVICSSETLIQCENNKWNNGVVIFTDKNRNKVVDADEHILFKTEHNIKYGRLTWVGSSSSTYVLTLQGDTGLPRGAPGSFYYCGTAHLENNLKLNISKMGNIRPEPNSNC
ncbi:MAG: GspH/FimT family protein [Acinetobacter sp.]